MSFGVTLALPRVSHEAVDLKLLCEFEDLLGSVYPSVRICAQAIVILTFGLRSIIVSYHPSFCPQAAMRVTRSSRSNAELFCEPEN